jgi:hypothetical protein
MSLLAFTGKTPADGEIITPMSTHRAPQKPINIAPPNALSQTRHYALFSDVSGKGLNYSPTKYRHLHEDKDFAELGPGSIASYQLYWIALAKTAV